MPKKLECTIPVLPVRDLARSRRYYVEALGFTLDWGEGDEARICSVSRDGHAIMLSALAPFEAPGCVWIGLEDASLFDDWRQRGVPVRQEPMNWSWAYEMKFADPDGNVLWLGTAPREELPRVDD